MGSHAEGSYTKTTGAFSHAEGSLTIANHRCQHVLGEYNIEDSSTAPVAQRGNYVEIVGNGSDDSHRSNAYTLDWSGNGTFAGKVTVGTAPTNDMDVATKAYVDAHGGTQSDWTEDDSTDGAYVLHKPAVVAGEGTNSVLEGQIEQNESAAVIRIRVTGAANATTYTYTTEDAIPSIYASQYYAKYGDVYTCLNGNIDTTNNTITFTTTLDDEDSISNHAVDLYYRYRTGTGEYAHAEGYMSVAPGIRSHAEGDSCKAVGSRSHAEGSGTYAANYNSHAEGSSTIASGTSSHAEGSSTIASGSWSHAEGLGSTASGTYSHAEGNYTAASGYRSHAEGYHTTASNYEAHAEGYYTIASGQQSHAEGYYTTASDYYTHAEGDHTTASNDASHAEGVHTTASGVYGAHAEGYYTTASGSAAHAEGRDTISAGNYQHVEGKYNIADVYPYQYAHIVGNGTADDARSNAYTLDWNGNGVYAGKVTVGAAPVNNMDVATKQYVDTATAGMTTTLAGLTDTTITTPTDGQLLKYNGTSGKWENVSPTTYSLSISNNVITLTGSDGSTSSITLPVYNGSVTVSGGGS